MGKHDAIMLRANVPADEYYREQINILQKKLEALTLKVEMQAEYIEGLEESNKALSMKLDAAKEAFFKEAIKNIGGKHE